jgi:ADP-heptose:LPS heptosyltransferase
MAESRQWGVDAFLKLALLSGRDRPWPVVIVGGPAERRIAERLQAERSLRWIDLTGRGPVSALAKIFRDARFTVSNDSGLAHAAALCGSPVEVIWGAGDPRHTAPIGPNRIAIHSRSIACWPCEKNTCGNSGGDFLRCLRETAPEAVWEEMKRRH